MTAVSGEARRARTRNSLIALGVLIIGMVVTQAVVNEVQSTQERQVVEQAQTVSDQLVRQLETSILPASLITHSLDSYVRGQRGEIVPTPTNEFMKALLEEGAFIRSVSLAPGNRLDYVQPLAGNAPALGLYLPDIPEQWAPMQAIIASKKPGLTGPFPLVQGGTGIAFRHPIFLAGDTYWGLGSAVIDAEAYLASAASIRGVDLTRVGLRSISADGTPGETFWGTASAFDRGAVVEVRPLGATWELAVVPEPVDTSLASLIRFVGTLSSMAFATLVFIALGAWQRRREDADRLAKLSAQVPGMLFQMQVAPDGTSSLPYVSASVEDIFGISPPELAESADELWERVDPADGGRVRKSIAEAIRTGSRWHDRVRMQGGDGQTRWYLTDATPESRFEQGAVLHGILTDISDEVAMAEQMRISASVFESTHDGILIMAPDGRIVDANPGFTAITGYTPDEVQGRTLEVLGSGLTPQDVYDDVRLSLDRTGFWRGELINRTRDGDVAAGAVSITTVTGESGEISHFVAVISALSALGEDLVTGLPGRQVVDDRLNQAVQRARAGGGRAALLVIGIDRFRDVNETFGHRIGDVVLRSVAERLRQVVREPETVARLGGDEFAVILSADASPEVVEGIASSIAEEISAPIELSEHTIHLTCSVGIAVFPEDSATAADLLTNADQAVRLAKSSGRDRYYYATTATQEAARERMRLTEDLRMAREQGQLHLVFQPVVDMASGRARKAEALMRWTHPDLGVISPNVFIPLAEASGQIKGLGSWAFEQILDVLVEARAIDPEFTIGFNLSPAEAMDPYDLHAQRLSRLAERGIPGNALIAEITEGLLLDRGPETIANIDAYRRAGLEFAIDDFGTGYSSLSYLQQLDVHYLKIDRSFVDGLVDGNESHALCVAIIEMAHALRLRVIAEGVETQDQYDLLRAAACDLAQGFHLARPMPAPELLAAIAAQSA